MKIINIVALILIVSCISVGAVEANGDMSVSGKTTTNALTLAGLDCTANANGGVLTTDDNGVVSCADDTDTTYTAGAGISITNNVIDLANVPTTYSVGDFAQGGIVFYVDVTGQHGLVAAKEDQNAGAFTKWYPGEIGFPLPTDIGTGAVDDGPYAGEVNTLMINTAYAHINNGTFAAQISMQYLNTEVGISYGDWYLPSIFELTLMHQNRDLIDSVALTNGGTVFGTRNYWSSTEENLLSAYVYSFDFDYAVGNAKDAADNARVRSVRGF